MPLHTIGARSVARSFYGVTLGDLWSIGLAILIFWMPGVDPKVVMQWIIDHPFGGSLAACSVFGVYIPMRLIEWGGLAFYTLLYQWEKYPNLPGAKAIHAAKIDPATPWPWMSPNKEVQRKFAVLQWRSQIYTLGMQIFSFLAQAATWATLVHIDWSSGSFNWNWIVGDPRLTKADPATIPPKSVVAYQIFVSTLVTELGFFIVHRCMHTKWLYRFHKRHHEYKELSIFSTYNVGPVDTVLQDFLPAGFGIIYFDMHIWTVWLFVLPLVANSLRDHSGYDNARLFPFLGFNPTQTLPMCTDADRSHELHHRHSNCNYGAGYLIFDRLFGTWRCPDTEEALWAEKRKLNQVTPVDSNGNGLEGDETAAAQSVDGVHSKKVD